MKEYFLEIFRKNEREINELYGIRAISCYLVILFHCFTFSLDFVPKSYRPILPVAQNVEFLMSLFFVISAFLVATSFSRELAKNDFRTTWKNFAIKRSLRIFPALYFLLFLTIFLMSKIVQQLETLPEPSFFFDKIQSVKHTLSHWWADAFYISNYFPNRILVQGWSLSMEEQFYLAMPFVFLLYTKVTKTEFQRISFLILLLLIPNGIRLYYFFYISLADYETYVIKVFHPIHTHFDSFVYGILLMELWKQKQKEVKKQLQNTFYYFCLFLSFIGFLWVLGLTYETAKLFFVVFRISFYSFFAFLIVYGCIFQLLPFLRWFLANHVLVFVGKLSYGIYLIHMLVNTVFLLKVFDHTNPEANDVSRILLASVWSFGISICIALLSYYIIEKPFLKVREWTQAKYDITNDRFYFVKAEPSELVFVSILLTLLSFSPYFMLTALAKTSFIPKSTISISLVTFCLGLPVLLNLWSLFRYKRIYIYQFLLKMRETK